MTTPHWRCLTAVTLLSELPRTHLAVDYTSTMSHMSFYLVSLHRSWRAATPSFTVPDELVEWAKKVTLLCSILRRLDELFSKCVIHLRFHLCHTRCALLRSCCLPLFHTHPHSIHQTNSLKHTPTMKNVILPRLTNTIVKSTRQCCVTRVMQTKTLPVKRY